MTIRHYVLTISNNKYRMGLIFNRLDPTLNGENMRFWLAFFSGLVLAYILSIWHEKHIIQQLKAWSYRRWKISFIRSNSDTIAHWSSIFWYTCTKSTISLEIIYSIITTYQIWYRFRQMRILRCVGNAYFIYWCVVCSPSFPFACSLVPRRYVLFYGLRGLCVGRVD